MQAALDGLPEEFAERLWNLEVVVEDEPSPEDLASVGLVPDDDLLGLYHGVPLTERGGERSGALPDVISIYRGPIERECSGDPRCIREEVRATVLHELAHYFGIDDARLEELGRG